MATPRAKSLQAFPLFAGLSGKDRELLASNLDEADFAAGTTLISQGKSNHTFFVLIEGQLDVTVSGEPRRKLGPGSFFGEISMGERDWATATVVTTSDVKAYVMSHAQFGTVCTFAAGGWTA